MEEQKENQPQEQQFQQAQTLDSINLELEGSFKIILQSTRMDLYELSNVALQLKDKILSNSEGSKTKEVDYIK